MGLFEDPGDSGDLYEKPLSELPFDTAVVRLWAPRGLVNITRVFAYKVASECYKCAWTFVADTGDVPVVDPPLPDGNVTAPESSDPTSPAPTQLPPPRVGAAWTENSKYGWSYSLRWDYIGDVVPRADRRLELCRTGSNSLGQYGVYDLSALPSPTDAEDGAAPSDPTCGFEVVKEPVAIYYGLLACFLFYLTLAIVYWLTSKLIFSKASVWSKRRKSGGNGDQPAVEDGLDRKKRDTAPVTASGGEVEMEEIKLDERTTTDADTGRQANLKESNVEVPTPRKRSRALDVFRGINIVMMIFVNAGGAGYYFFEHAPWNGLYVADLVFPWFVWIMGAAIPLALGAHLRRLEKDAVPDPRRKILLDSGWRAVKLFFIGLVLCTLGGRNDLQKLRVFGVLQRLGVCYFLATAIFVPAAKTAYPPPPTNSKWKSAFHGVITMLPAWILTLPLVIIHTVVTFLLPVPGCPTGYLGPGGLHEDGAHYPECVGGATGYIDREILTLNHMYPWPTPQELYRSAAFDPEGLWGILPAVFQTVLGAQAGLTLLLYKEHKTRVFHWVSWGVGSGILGLILAFAGTEGEGAIPINKNLWSLSFVLVTSALGFFFLVICYALTDMTSVWKGAPFVWPGMNSLAMYIGHSVAYNLFPWRYRYGPMRTHFDHLVENLWGTSLWIFVAYIMYRKKLFLKV